MIVNLNPRSMFLKDHTRYELSSGGITIYFDSFRYKKELIRAPFYLVQFIQCWIFGVFNRIDTFNKRF